MSAMVLVAVMLLGQAKNATAELVAKLNSTDRMERHNAAVELNKLRSLPESALSSIIGYLQREVTQAMVPGSELRMDKTDGSSALPLVGDELSVARLKANPSHYVEQPFVLVGGVTVSDYYNYGFRDTSHLFYSFNLATLNPSGDIGDSIPLYVSRWDGAALAERTTRMEERNNHGMTGVRLKCVIHRNRLDDLEHATQSIEATDWQVLSDDGKTWMPWTFEGIYLGYSLMFKTGVPSMAACLDLIMNEQQFQDTKADEMLKGTAIVYILKLPQRYRDLAAKRLVIRSKKVKGKLAVLWSRRLMASLEQGRLVL